MWFGVATEIEGDQSRPPGGGGHSNGRGNQPGGGKEQGECDPWTGCFSCDATGRKIGRW